MNIGQVIRKYRKEAGITQGEMAKRLGVSTPAVNKWENGNSNPDIELLAPIARLLHVSLDTLLSFVCAEKNVLETYEVVEQLLKSVDSLFDFEKSVLYQHMSFKKPESAFAGNLKEKLLEGFRDEESFGYMKGNEAWMKLIEGEPYISKIPIDPGLTNQKTEKKV